MDEHDDFRRIADERDRLIGDLRRAGAVDLDIVRGCGFEAPLRTVRKAHTGGGSGTYIGTVWEPYAEDRQQSKRRH